MTGKFKYLAILLILLNNLNAIENNQTTNGINIVNVEQNSTINKTNQQENVKNDTTTNIQQQQINTKTELEKENNKKEEKNIVVDNILNKSSFNFLEDVLKAYGLTNFDIIQIKKINNELNEILIKINSKEEIIFQNKNGFIINNKFIEYKEIMEKIKKEEVVNIKNKLTHLIYSKYKEFLYQPFGISDTKKENLLVLIPFQEKDRLSLDKLKEITNKDYNTYLLYLSDQLIDQKCIIEPNCVQLSNMLLQSNNNKQELIIKYIDLINDYKQLLELPEDILFLKN